MWNYKIVTQVQIDHCLCNPPILALINHKFSRKILFACFHSNIQYSFRSFILMESSFILMESSIYSRISVNHIILEKIIAGLAHFKLLSGQILRQTRCLGWGLHFHTCKPQLLQWLYNGFLGIMELHPQALELHIGGYRYLLSIHTFTGPLVLKCVFLLHRYWVRFRTVETVNVLTEIGYTAFVICFSSYAYISLII